jgi:TolB-like protein
MMNYVRRFPAIFILTFVVILSAHSFALAFEKEVNNLSSSMAEKIADAGKAKIAVVDFTDLQGNVTELGRFLAEEFSVALTELGKGFEVVDRTHLKSIIAEHKLSATGLIDPKTARKLGKIAGVEALITGTLTPFGDSIRISVKILDTATAKIIGARRGNIAKTKAIEELLSRGLESRSSYSPGASSSSYIPSLGGSKSKEVGDITVSLKKIIIASKNEVRVIVRFFNQSDKRYRLAVSKSASITNEKGNAFKYTSNSTGYSYSPRDHVKYIKWNRSMGLNSKSKAATTLFFRPMNIENAKDIDDVFSASISYMLLNVEEEETEGFSVSFTDIKAQKLR